jgi:FixJ family two-component response regulator
MKSNLGIGRGSAIALLLERNHQGAVNLESLAQKCGLTRRETETVALLIQDLGTKQIASRMNRGRFRRFANRRPRWLLEWR